MLESASPKELFCDPLGDSLKSHDRRISFSGHRPPSEATDGGRCPTYDTLLHGAVLDRAGSVSNEANRRGAVARCSIARAPYQTKPTGAALWHGARSRGLRIKRSQPARRCGTVLDRAGSVSNEANRRGAVARCSIARAPYQTKPTGAALWHGARSRGLRIKRSQPARRCGTVLDRAGSVSNEANRRGAVARCSIARARFRKEPPPMTDVRDPSR